MIKWITAALVCIIVGITTYWFTINEHVRYLIINQPENENPLFWTTEQRDAAFQSLEKLQVLPYRTINNGNGSNQLSIGKGLSISDQDTQRYFDQQRIAGLVVLHKGELVYENYGLGFSKDDKWTSFSVAKSFTSTLVGAALKDGHINSLDDKVSDYVANLKGSHYDDVTIKQLLTMTSGIGWDEDYDDPNSDVNQFNTHEPAAGMEAIVSYMRTLPRAEAPGTKWLYSTGETNLIGVLISQATGKPLSEYLSEKIWQHIGAEHSASWLLGATNHEISGCCIQASTRDFALFGDFIANGAVVNGESILPEGYLAAATSKQADTGSATGGYGYQWWTFNDGTFHGRGIFGQGIFIDRARDLVIAVNGNWPKASSKAFLNAKLAMYHDIQALVDQQLR